MVQERKIRYENVTIQNAKETARKELIMQIVGSIKDYFKNKKDLQDNKTVQKNTFIVEEYSVIPVSYVCNSTRKENKYNDPLEWAKIFEAHKDTIESANLIYPGQLLIIPRDMKSKIR